MVFQQRNGRIDRYGQERIPEIVYLITDSDNARIRGDTRILEVLIEKDEHAWPRIHYLWALHPVLRWLDDQVLAAFGRHQAPAGAESCGSVGAG